MLNVLNVSINYMKNMYYIIIVFQLSVVKKYDNLETLSFLINLMLNNTRHLRLKLFFKL